MSGNRMTVAEAIRLGLPFPQGTTEIDVWIKGPDGLLQSEKRIVNTVTTTTLDVLTGNGLDIG